MLTREETEAINLQSRRFKIEYEQGWSDEIVNIPFIQFPRSWKIQVIPPFGDAVVRFRVELPSGVIKSVYLDTRMSLGCCAAPYWEVYPVGNDVGRCMRQDVSELLRLIKSK